MRDQAEKQRLYKKIWQQVESVYRKGFCVSERGLQAVLYAELRKELPSDSYVVVEPTWNTSDGKVAKPDLVIVEGEKITDIFELKFVPHGYAEWKEDIEKLFRYVKKIDDRYPVHLDPKTGQTRQEDYLPVQDGCLLHFVVVARHDAEAVWPDDLKKEVREWNTDNEKWNHWFGRTGPGDGKWDIELACH